jgi:hypothetical protein
MKTIRASLLVIVLFAVTLTAVSVMGQDPAATAAPSVDSTAVAATSVAGPLLDAALGKYGWLLMAVTVVGSLRLVVKPIIAFAHSIADATATPKDNELIAKIESSKALSTVCFCLDWLGSFKLRK